MTKKLVESKFYSQVVKELKVIIIYFFKFILKKNKFLFSFSFNNINNNIQRKHQISMLNLHYVDYYFFLHYMINVQYL